jgi:hypothetical protein
MNLGEYNLPQVIFMGIQSQDYYWKAEYEDGSVLKQYENGEENQFNDIDQDRLDIFSWISDHDILPTYSIDLKDWQRLIAFRRHIIQNNQDEILIYALGWQSTIDGSNYKTINFIFPDGSVVMGEEI